MGIRILITGASGSGTTTLAATLSDALGFVHLDADDYYWEPTDPPFSVKRDRAERRALLLTDLSGNGGIVVSGSVMDWGDDIEEQFALIVFLYLDTAVRLERLRTRELERFGRIDAAFMLWAAQYDEGPPEGRSLVRHRAWLAARTCPILELHGDQSISERAAAVIGALSNITAEGGLDASG